ncbi:glycoside hydrolase family 16 protein [Actinomadura litoris]|uniref:Family 16 glycosylhydrolase n=1 Tax=Actinomadura litoris TaxID=2678616 RepID=A0A7K1LC33_9ACTN|nr:glycoside hydrolase family 16 protein [Actinomadura litoris]MUN41978.1 family 16 glycosylhydrolase [Actinomadura litoris]
MHFLNQNRMALLTGGILAASVSAAAAVQGGAADPERSAVPAGALEHAVPAVTVAKPGARSHEDAWDSARRGPATAARRYGWGRPVASDDFRRLDPRDWEVYEGKGNGGLGRRVRSAVAVRNGTLRITGRKNGDTGGVAWLRGARKLGRWEARVRMNRACACYNANLLLWPVGGGGGTDPQGGGGEIDYMETYGDDGLRKGTNFFLHYGPEKHADRLDSHVKTDLRKWHAFAVEWTAASMTAYIDGRVWFRTRNRKALPPGKMGQAIQLDWFPSLRKRTARGVGRTAPATLEVDWIRMYALGGK